MNYNYDIFNSGDSVKNHTIKIYVVRSVCRKRQRAMTEFPFTPYPPTVRLLRFSMSVCGRKGYGNYYENFMRYTRTFK